MPQIFGVLTTALVLLPALAADVYGQHGERLLSADQGVEMRGSVTMANEGGGRCNVLETDTSYEETKHNDGALMDIWRVDYMVRNRSGRWLDRLAARYHVDSEWPDCTNWDDPVDGDWLLTNILWGGSFRNIQEVGRNSVAPDQVLIETEYFTVLRGDPAPRFSEWSMDFSFAIAPPSTGGTEAPASPGAASPEQENLFWQSIMNSADPAEFEAYLAQFPGGVFRSLAEARLAALRTPVADPPPTAPRRADAAPDRTPPSAPRRPGEVFRDCDECPEMVVMPGGRLALGRYEVTVGEYRAFASATGGGGDAWREPSFPQTDRHPVTWVSWDDAQEYVSWLSRTTGATYRLPTESEWGSAAAGSQRGCDSPRTGNRGTCPVGSYGTNAAGLSDMVGNLWEWTEDCWEGDCGRRVLRGGSWVYVAELQRPGARSWFYTGLRYFNHGFRVARTLD